MPAPKIPKPTVKKILTLGQKEWFSGVSAGYRLQDKGLFAYGEYVCPFVDPFIGASQIGAGSSNVGLFQTSAKPTDLTGIVVTDNIQAGVSIVTSASAGNLYLLGSGGHFYVLDMVANTIADRRAASTIATPANGMDIFQTVGGTKYLYYMRQNTIGRWDLGDTWDDNWSTSLNNTLYHPTHFFKGAIYFGNGNAVGSIYDIGGVVTTSYVTTPGGLQLPQDYIVSALEDDGDFLIIAITKNQGSNTLASDTRILFWDTIQNRANSEWNCPDYSINSLAKFEGGLIAFGGRAMWYFNSSTIPTKIRNLDIGTAIQFGFPQAADRFNDAVIWGGGNAQPGLSTYGSIMPELPKAYFQPYSGLTGAATFVRAMGEINRIWVGTAAGKLYSYSLSSGGGTTTTHPETVYIDLQDEIMIHKMDVWLGEPLAAGDPSDALTINWAPNDATGFVTFGTVSFNIHGAANRAEVFPAAAIIASQIKLQFNFSAGNVKIKQIDLYGEPILRYSN